jgi:hypothetical protein
MVSRSLADEALLRARLAASQAVPTTLVDPTLINPTTLGTSVFQPPSLGPVAAAQVPAQIFTGQTTPGEHLSVQIGPNIPLPGQPGSPSERGVLTVDVEIMMASVSTAAGAAFKVSQSWFVATGGAVTPMSSNVVSQSVGTNSGAPPTGWGITLNLDGGSQNAQILVNGDATVTVDVIALAQWKYGA